MPHQRVRFPGSQGTELVGRLEGPEGEPAAYALVAHCFTCSKDLKSAGVLCRELIARGIAVLRFDFTGLGESAGDFADTNFSSNVLDLLAAADFLRRERRAPALLVGHSLGGTAMLAAASRIPEAVAVATLGAPSDTSGLRATLAARLGETPATLGRAGTTGAEEANAADPADIVEVDLGGASRVRVRRQLLDDLAADPLDGVVGKLGKPLLIFHSPVDRTVPIENAERLFLAARHPKSFVSLGTADHLLSDPRDAAQAGAILAAWALRYLEPHVAAGGTVAHANAEAAKSTVHTATRETADAGEGSTAAVDAAGAGGARLGGEGGAEAGGESVAVGAAPSPAAGAAAQRTLAPGEVEVSDLAAGVGLPAGWEATTAGGGHALRQEVRMGRHSLTIDEPVAQGGADAGPTPYGLLLAALGGCTAITMRLYAERKKLPLTGARVVLRSSKIHAADCRSCAEGTGEPKLDRIDIEIELQGELDEAQRARLLTIAGHCPVHRTLESKIDIVTRLV